MHLLHIVGGNQDLSGDIPAGIKSVLESNRSSLELFDISESSND